MPAGRIRQWHSTYLTGSNGISAAIIVVVIVSYYLLGFPPHYENISNFYSMMGESFLKGQTYLDQQVSPLLLATPDPYEPYYHRRFGLWDASLYQGKYYLYFGPIPAILLWIPAKLLTGISLSTSAMAFVFISVGTVCLLLILSGMVAALPRPQSRVAFVAGSLAIAYGTWLPHILLPATYEVAAAGAYCFNAIGLFCMWRALRSNASVSYAALGFSGLCFGLAIGCRYIHALNGLLLLIGCWMACKPHPCERVKITLALFLPWLLVIECLMAYNFVRFGNIFETGMSYLLTVENMHRPDFSALRPEKFLNNLYFYFFRPMDWKSELTFPPFYVPTMFHGFLWKDFFVSTSEPVYGLLVNSPFVLFLLLPLRIRTHQTLAPAANKVLFYSTSVYGSAVTCYMLFFFYTTQRYAVDFSAWLMLAATIRFIAFLGSAKTRRSYRTIATAGIMLASYSAFNGIMLNLSR